MTGSVSGRATIRTRVAGGVLLSLAAALSAAGFAIDAAVDREIRSELDSQLKSEALALAGAAHWEDGAFNFHFDDATLRPFLTPRSGAYFEIRTSGEVAARSRSLDGAALAAFEEPPGHFEPMIAYATTAGPFETELRQVAAVMVRTTERDRSTGEVRPAPPRLLAVRVARSTTDAEAAVLRVRRAMWTALPLAALCGAAGAFLVARRATTPIRTLSASARALASSGKGLLDAGATVGELRDLAGTLNDAFAQVAAAAERETRFASDAAHELRTPLAVLRMSLELALSRPRTEAESRAALEDALAAALRLNDLSESLLLLHRAEHGSAPLVRLDFRDVVREAAAESDASGRGPSITLDLGDDSAPLDGRRMLLVRMVGNLLQNARRYGGGAIRMVVRTENGSVVLTADDDGPGFPAELLPRLFERLARGDYARARSEGGAGLGLAIVRTIAESHGGRAAAENRQGGGARIVIRLPAA